MNPTQNNRFALRAARDRKRLYGSASDGSGPISCVVGGLSCPLIFTEPTQSEKLDDGGWDVTVTALARIVRADLPSGLKIEKNTVFVFANRQFICVQTKDHPGHPEIVAGLREGDVNL